MQSLVLKMADSIAHRGPDDVGHWEDASAGVALGFRRLAILDLSENGRQPMRSACGRYIIVFNGEVYNFRAIRAELEREGVAPEFRGGSDTEVMLAAISAWGLAAAVQRFIGMFAFALWDRQERTLHLVRDRLGVKPLYYGWVGKTFLFGSELKALQCYPDCPSEIDRDALALFLRFGYIPAPYTIYHGLNKLPPGTILTLAPGESRHRAIQAYWSAKGAAERGLREPFAGTEAEAIDHLDALIRDAVGLRMISDAPLGAFLSGGIDSSLVAAQMQAQSGRPVRSFTIGFYEDDHNEARYAKKIAAHLGLEHTELYLTPGEAMEVIPCLPEYYDEPFADSSQIPTCLVSALARKRVTVSLSGDGGDELFGGYSRYFWTQRLWNQFRRIPYPARVGVSRQIRAVPPQTWEALARLLRSAGATLPAQPADKIAKMGELLPARSLPDVYRYLISHWKEPDQIALNAREPTTLIGQPDQFPAFPDFREAMMYFDTSVYLPDDILVKIDRASMSVSLEAREPLLDHRLLEFVWSLPLSYRIRAGQGKWALRQVLKRYAPLELVERPKMGFVVPMDSWLRGPLRDWAETLLNERRLRAEGYFDPRPIRKKWDEHLSNQYNWQYYLWNILMFQAWLEKK